MRSLFVGLVATALAVFAVGDPVLAFQAKAAKAPKVDPVVEAQTLAPVVIQGAKLPCTLADVRNDRSSDKQVVLELACKEGIGFIVVSAKDGSNAQAQECVDTRQKIDVVCSLPGNVNPAKGLQPYLTRAGSDCVVDKANVLGATPTKTIYEVGCTNGLGQMLSIDLPRGDTAKVVAAPCLAISALLPGKTCSLTTEAANLAAVKALAAKADKPCAVTKERYVGAAEDGSQYFEYACASGPGFIVQANAKGEYKRTVSCALASGLGGCTLSDTKAAIANQSVAYTNMVKAAGFNCDVKEFLLFPPKAGSTATETIEFACANRRDGGVAIINGSSASVLNCMLAQPNGYRCSYTKPEDTYATLTDNLKTAGKQTCAVSNARAIGASTKSAFLEVACADGAQGYIVAYPLGLNKPTEAVLCSQAGYLGGCSLPGNKKG